MGQFEPTPSRVPTETSKGSSGLAIGIGYAATDRWRFNATFSGSPDQGAYGGVVSSSFTLN
jgi:hypothetical protein